MPQKKHSAYTIVSVGGSLVIPPEGIDTNFLVTFKNLILRRVEDGQKFVLIIGGGSTARRYQEAARAAGVTTADQLDMVGIAATALNAQLVCRLFGDAAYPDVVANPTKKIRTKKSVIIAAGWKPGCSTDMDAVLFAKQFGAKSLVNLSNIAQVYDKDPNVFSDAKPLESIDWATYRRDIAGDGWEPGKSAPFDPVASALAEKLKLTVAILKGTDAVQTENAIVGRPFFGTVIHP
jgi:uridylate kinase